MSLDADDAEAIAEMIAGYVESEPPDWRDQRAPPMHRRAQIDTLVRLFILLCRHTGAERLMLEEVHDLLSAELHPRDPNDPKQVKATADYGAGQRSVLVHVRSGLYSKWNRKRERAMGRWSRMRASRRRREIEKRNASKDATGDVES